MAEPRYAVDSKGVRHQFPADATDAEISGFLKAIPALNASKMPESKVPSWVDVANDLVYGAAKGLATSTTNAVRMVPGVGPATLAAGNYLGGKAGELAYGQKSEPVTREQANATLEPTNTAQKVGKTAEQIAEFFVPAGAARLSAVEGLAKAIPNAASPAAMKAMNKIASVAGRTIGEAGSAGTVSALQNSENPGATAAMAGAGPLVGQVAGAGAKLLKYPLTQKMVALLAGVAGANALGGATNAVGIGAGFGAYNLTRSVAQKLIAKPGVVPKLNNLAVKGSEQAARLLAAIYSVTADPEEQDGD